MNGRIVLAWLSSLITAVPLAAQAPLGGCPRGTEQGTVRVRAQTLVADWGTGNPLTSVLPGDEVRLCRYDGGVAIITLWTDGYGYRVPRANVELLGAPTRRAISSEERGCIYGDILRAHANATARQQDVRFLVLARKRNLTLAMLRTLDGDLTLAFERGGSQASLTVCAGSASAGDGSPAVSAYPRTLAQAELTATRMLAFDAVDSALAWGATATGEQSGSAAITAAYWLGIAGGLLTATGSDSVSDPGGWRVYRIVSDYERLILPEFHKLARGESLPVQNTVMPILTWLKLSTMRLAEERKRPLPE